MGWYPTEITNTLEEKLNNKFYKDVWNLLDDLENQRLEFRAKYGPMAYEKTDYPHCVDNFSDFGLNHYKQQSLEYDAFNIDHMEHIAQWLWDKRVWAVFKKHKITGEYVLLHEDGGGYYAGIKFVNGIPYDINVEIKIKKGKRLK